MTYREALNKLARKRPNLSNDFQKRLESLKPAPPKPLKSENEEVRRIDRMIRERKRRAEDRLRYQDT